MFIQQELANFEMEGTEARLQASEVEFYGYSFPHTRPSPFAKSDGFEDLPPVKNLDPSLQEANLEMRKQFFAHRQKTRQIEGERNRVLTQKLSQVASNSLISARGGRIEARPWHETPECECCGWSLEEHRAQVLYSSKAHTKEFADLVYGAPKTRY
jgi:hypothetical protein